MDFCIGFKPWIDLTAIETYSIQVFDFCFVFEILPDFVKIVNIKPKIYHKHGKIYNFFSVGTFLFWKKTLDLIVPADILVDLY